MGGEKSPEEDYLEANEDGNYGYYYGKPIMYDYSDTDTYDREEYK